MHNIIKALNYQTRRDNFLIYAILAGLGGIALSLMMYLQTGNFESLTGGYAAACIGSGDGYSFAVFFSTLLLATRICGWDYADKTMNYEILAGHSRRDVYWSRVITCLSWCMITTMLICILPIAVLTLINGWGEQMPLKGCLLRYVLLIFPVFRTICEYMLITFLTRSCYTGMVTGFLFTELTSVLVMILTNEKILSCTWHLGSTNISELFYFNMEMGYMDGKDVEVFLTDLEPSFIAGTITASLAVGISCILLGYLLFRKSDVN